MYIACPRFSKLGDVRKELETYIYMEWMVQGSWKMMWAVLKELWTFVKENGESRSS